MEIIYWGHRVERFISELERETSTKVRQSLFLLEEQGHLLDMPDSKSLGKGLFELRTQGKVKVRLMYVFHNDRAYILHGFIKKAWRISRKDIEYSRKVQKEISSFA